MTCRLPVPTYPLQRAAIRGRPPRSDGILAATVRLAASGLVLGTLAGGAGCTGSAPPEPPIEMPPPDVLARLEASVPTTRVLSPITIDTKSCTFARYLARLSGTVQTFVLLHPLRTRCELWLGRFEPSANLEYCRFPREDLLPIGTDAAGRAFRIDDPEHCVFASDLPPSRKSPENANARAATQAFVQIETN